MLRLRNFVSLCLLILFCASASRLSAAAVPEEYQPKYDEGYGVGYKVGYTSGMVDGKQRGKSEGQVNGNSEGYWLERGLSAGV